MRLDIETAISTGSVRDLRDHGVLFFDVDDTLLSRSGGINGKGETFYESPAAMHLPKLLDRGFRVVIITGHETEQLFRRLIGPLMTATATGLADLRVYTNRGGTGFSWDGRSFVEDHVYSAGFKLTPAELEGAVRIVAQVADKFSSDIMQHSDRIVNDYPGFLIGELPVKVTVRADTIVSAKPFPSSSHCLVAAGASIRDTAVSEIEALIGCEPGLSNLGVQAAGRGTIETARHSLSKTAAAGHAFERIAGDLGISLQAIEHASIFVGDEFGIKGNDRPLSEMFSGARCISVAPLAERQQTPNNVINFSANNSNIYSTAKLIDRLLQLSE